MPLVAKQYQTCIRRVKGVRCTSRAEKYCKEHNNIKCSSCGERDAVYECRTCDKPLCGSCLCHDSFGY